LHQGSQKTAATHWVREIVSVERSKALPDEFLEAFPQAHPRFVNGRVRTMKLSCQRIIDARADLDPRLPELLAKRRAAAEPDKKPFHTDIKTAFHSRLPEAPREEAELAESGQMFSPSSVDVLRDSLLSCISEAAETRRSKEEDSLQALCEMLARQWKDAIEAENSEQAHLSKLKSTKAQSERIRLLLLQALPERQDGEYTPIGVYLNEIEAGLEIITAQEEILEGRIAAAGQHVTRIREEWEHTLAVLAAAKQRRGLVHRALELTTQHRHLGNSIASSPEEAMLLSSARGHLKVPIALSFPDLKEDHFDDSDGRWLRGGGQESLISSPGQMARTRAHLLARHCKNAPPEPDHLPGNSTQTSSFHSSRARQ
jgi:hypothetical protein